MANTPDKKPRGPDRTALSRREVLVGAAATALFATTASTSAQQFRGDVRQSRSVAPARRFMSAAAVLGDGRVLVTGGFDKPFAKGESPRALNTALIYSPQTGEFTSAAPMKVPRARHAAVALSDGRVAVVGGTSQQPTSSVEVYDPASDTWTNSQPLAQPRYDHVAVCDGNSVYVIGGTSLSMVSSVETVYPGATTDF